MGLFDIFGKKSKGLEKQSHIKNLISVAMADGRMDANEAQALLHVSKRLGVEESEVREIISNHAKIEFSLPPLHKDRVSLLWDYICLIIADGRIEEAELVLFERFAARLLLRGAVISSLIRKFSEWATSGLPLDSFKEEFLILMGNKNSFEDR